MQELTLDRFLASVERKAYRMAYLAIRNPDDALDVVQDVMFKLVQKYGSRPSSEWRPLFYRILETRLLDWHRRQSSRNKLFVWFGQQGELDEDGYDEMDGLENLPVAEDISGLLTPEHAVRNERAMEQLEQALQALPLRQQQAFLLRNWEGMDVRETALAMQCTEGSVKTHYSRAVHALRTQLEDHWP